MFSTQDEILTRLRDLLKNDANATLKEFVNEIGVNLDDPHTGVKHRKAFLTKRLNNKYTEESKTDETKPAKVDEQSAAKEKEAGDILKEEPIFKEMEKVFAKRKEWVEKDKEARIAFLNFLEKAESLSTEKEKMNFIEELEKKKEIWLASPVEEVVKEIILKLKNEK